MGTNRYIAANRAFEQAVLCTGVLAVASVLIQVKSCKWTIRMIPYIHYDRPSEVDRLHVIVST